MKRERKARNLLKTGFSSKSGRNWNSFFTAENAQHVAAKVCRNLGLDQSVVSVEDRERWRDETAAIIEREVSALLRECLGEPVRVQGRVVDKKRGQWMWSSWDALADCTHEALLVAIQPIKDSCAGGEEEKGEG